MKRRDILKTGALTAAAGMLGCARSVSRASGGVIPVSTLPRLRRVRNVIFLIYDGTGYEDAAAAGYFARRLLGRPFVFERFVASGAAGSLWTSSLTSIVTDSSAASTAFGTGRKIVNIALSMYPDGRPLTTIMDLARDRGMMTGFVTTTRVTHATPAGFFAKVNHRDLEEEIALQYLSALPDVMLGGGSGVFESAGRQDGRDLFAEFRARGYDVVYTADALDRSNASRLLGTFAPGMDHCPFEIDRRHQGAAAPSLAQMTRKALDVMGGAGKGFVMQVEAGRIDLANHYSDPGGMIWDWMAADEALEMLMDFVDRDGETLLIMACDHDTGGSVVYGTGPWFTRSTESFLTLGDRRSSNEWFIRRMGERPSADDVTSGARDYLGITLTPDQAAQAAAVLGTRPTPANLRQGHRNAFLNHPDNTLNQILSTSAGRNVDRPNIAYATGQHTAGMVPAVLYGPMVQRGGLGVLDNTCLFNVMTESLGIDFQNPMMTEDEVRGIELPSDAEAWMHD